jgi:RNA polymerase sigma factor (sigma-70 family)
MATDQVSEVIRQLRVMVLPGDGDGLTDGQLLRDYVRRRDEAALTVLVRRHGPMVWGVCRRILGSVHDAEDAFQASFLVLVRKAASIAAPDLVANWLYGVACQTATKARATAARRRQRERQVAAMPEPEAVRPDPWDDLRPLLDRELSALPDKYRVPVVLCDLEGRTRKAVARQLGCPEGTVAGRLARARALLARRLARRGLPISATALAVVLAQDAASAGVRPALVARTVEVAGLFAAGRAGAAAVVPARAVTLADGVLRGLFLTHLKYAAAVFVMAGALGIGLAGVARQAADRPVGRPAPPQPVAAEIPAREKQGPAEQRPDPATPAREEADPPPAEVNGVVRDVDAPNRTLTVSRPGGEATFRVAPDARVEVDFKPGLLGRLPRGALVSLRDFVDRRTARSVRATGSSDFGTVKAVDPRQDTITVTGGSPGERTYRVPADAPVVIDGRPASLAAVPPGAHLHALNLCADQKTAHDMNVVGPNLQHVPVKAVDAVRKTLTIGDQAPAEVAGKTFPVAPDAEVLLDGKPGRLADVPAGAFVNLLLSVNRSTARRLDVEGPWVGDCGGSRVKSVDTGKNTVTFADEASPCVAGKTFAVAPDANLVIDGRPGRLAELPPGCFVNLTLSVDRRKARVLLAQGPRVRGVVKGVNAPRNTVTVGNGDFAVAKDALVVIDGRPGALAGLATGASVTLTLRVDGKTVGMIQANAP